MRNLLSDDLEGLTTSGAEAENRKVIVQRCGSIDAQAVHDREAGAIDDREILVAPGSSHQPCRLQISQRDWFDQCYSTSESVPESLGSIALNSVSEQGPGFNQNMIGGEECFARAENFLCAKIAAVG